MGNIVVIGIIVILLAIAIVFLIKEKKKGTKCIGCPSSEYCNKKSCKGNRI